MFSGKTEELIRRMKRAKFARQNVEIFKPQIDVRYSEEEVVSLVLSFKSNAKLIAPKYLVKKLRDEVEEIGEMYLQV